MLTRAYRRRSAAAIGGVIHSYDVVNEAVDARDRRDARNQPSRRAMGSAEAVLDLAFHTARERAGRPARLQRLYELGAAATRRIAPACCACSRASAGAARRSTRSASSRISAAATVPTITADVRGPQEERAWRHFLDEVTGMGYKLLITEFDVNDRAIQRRHRGARPRGRRLCPALFRSDARATRSSATFSPGACATVYLAGCSATTPPRRRPAQAALPL